MNKPLEQYVHNFGGQLYNKFGEKLWEQLRLQRDYHLYDYVQDELWQDLYDQFNTQIIRKIEINL